MKRTHRSAAFVAVLFAGTAALATACGGNKGQAKFPGVGSADAMPTAGAVGTNSEGKQVGISDTDSGGDVDADKRPHMSASAKSKYDRGMDLWASGDLGGAATAFTEATQADPNAYQAFYSLGVIQERLQNPAALTSYRQSYTLQATYEPAIVAYGILLGKKGSLSEADDFLTKKKGDMPKSAAVLAALAEIKSLKRDSGTAQQYAQEALKMNPDYRPAMVVLARDHYRNRRLDLALYALSAILDGLGSTPEALAANPARDKNNSEARLLRAIIYKEQNKRSSAIDEFKKAIDLRPDFVEARVQLAAYYLQAGNADEAKPLLEQALKYDQNHLQAHLNLGDAYRIIGSVPDAKKELEWVASKDASLPQVHYSLGLLYLFAQSVPGVDAKGQLKQAIASLEKYQQLRGKAAPGGSDDSDQLLLRAKVKLEGLEAAEKAAAAPPPSAAPAASGSATP
jgi:Tfp pilus assembly protein PilF